MFSFRTTSIFEQADNTLNKGRLLVLSSESAWYPSLELYLWELLAQRWNVVRFERIEERIQEIDIDGVDAVVIEYQHTGDRFDPFLGTLDALFKKIVHLGDSCAVYILDKFNPGGRQVEGIASNYLPHKHGLTIGEVANFFYSELNAHFPLHIISANATGAGRELMEWTIPITSDFAQLFSCHFHSGQYLWNGTNMSHGEGTSRPYEFFGAPFLERIKSVEAAYDKGVYMRKATFTPLSGEYAGKLCYGFQLLPNPTEQYNSFVHTVRLIRYFKDNYPEFEIRGNMAELVNDSQILEYFDGRANWENTREHIKTEEQKWLRKAKKYLLYDEPIFRVK